METETILLGGVFVSVLLLLAALMVALGDQHSRFGSVLRCGLASGILALVVVYDVPARLHKEFPIGAPGTAALWVAAVVGAIVFAFGAIVQLAAWLRWGEGDRPLRSPKDEAREDAEAGAEREQREDGQPESQ